MTNDEKKFYSWNLINTVIAFLALLSGAFGIGLSFYLQSVQTQKSDKEKLVEHLQAIIPECKGFSNQFGDNAAVLTPCYNCTPYMGACKDCDQSRNPVQNPLLYHHYTECKRISEGIPKEMSGFDYMLMAIAAERIGFYREAADFFSQAEKECEKTPTKSDDLVILVNFGHFEYMNYQRVYGINLDKAGQSKYEKALSLADTVYGNLGDLGHAEITAQWALDSFVLGHNHADGVRYASDAINLFKLHPSNEARLRIFWTQLTYLAQTNSELKFWLGKARESGLFPSHFIDSFDRQPNQPHSQPFSYDQVHDPNQSYTPPPDPGNAPTFQYPSEGMKFQEAPTYPILRETTTVPLNSNSY